MPETPGLDRLAHLQREGKSLFHGDRRPGPVDRLYPSVLLTRFEPERTRGIWVPQVGLLPPCALVTYVFPSGLAAAMAAVTQSLDGTLNFHTDAFPDGVVAATFGEGLGNRGATEIAASRISRLRDREPAGDYFVNVLSRLCFPEDRLGFPVPGVYPTARAVRVVERVRLFAGDLRQVLKILGEVPWLDTVERIRAPPFTGPYASGGQLQFYENDGERVLPLRMPSDWDRHEALSTMRNRGRRWLDKIGVPLESLDPASLADAYDFSQSLGGSTGGALGEGWAPVFRATSSEGSCSRDVLDGVARHLSAHCTRPVSVHELVQLGGMSKSQLYVAFRERFGCSPGQYATRLRLELAERLLRTTRLSVSEVAERCGFEVQGSLTRSLRKARGVTPLALRRSPGASSEAERKDRTVGKEG